MDSRRRPIRTSILAKHRTAAVRSISGWRWTQTQAPQSSFSGLSFIRETVLGRSNSIFSGRYHVKNFFRSFLIPGWSLSSFRAILQEVDEQVVRFACGVLTLWRFEERGIGSFPEHTLFELTP
jgi:hypothetical protein